MKSSHEPVPVKPREPQQVVETWLESCRRKGEISRNTVAVGLVALDHLLAKCPVSRSDVFTSGGELKGARSGLGKVLEKHGVPRTYLREATTRQASHDAERLLRELDFGAALARQSKKERGRLLQQAIAIIVREAHHWLQRQNIKISCDRQSSPAAWLTLILDEAKGKSAGRVEQHLVGAKLQLRHPTKKVPNYPGAAGDLQTGRPGDFALAQIAYHVTATPGREVIRKCKQNVLGNKHPVLLVPRSQVERARILADEEGVSSKVTVLAIEDFIGQNVIEISVEKRKDFFLTLKEMVDEYNRRVEEVETDMALKIELH